MSPSPHRSLNALVVGVAVLALALTVMLIIAGRSAAAPQRSFSEEESWRVNCGHLGVECPADSERSHPASPRAYSSSHHHRRHHPSSRRPRR